MTGRPAEETNGKSMMASNEMSIAAKAVLLERFLRRIGATYIELQHIADLHPSSRNAGNASTDNRCYVYIIANPFFYAGGAFVDECSTMLKLDVDADARHSQMLWPIDSRSTMKALARAIDKCEHGGGVHVKLNGVMHDASWEKLAIEDDLHWQGA